MQEKERKKERKKERNKERKKERRRRLKPSSQKLSTSRNVLSSLKSQFACIFVVYLMTLLVTQIT